MDNQQVPRAEQQLMMFLEQLNIKVKTYRHEPVYTVEQAMRIKSVIPEAPTKNLFVKDKKRRFFLITALAETKIRLNELSKVLGVQRLHFARPEELAAYLQVEPGSVTPFALMHKSAASFSFILDDAILREQCTGFHPLHNAATTIIQTNDLQRFLTQVSPIWQLFNAGNMTVRTYSP